MHFKHPLFASTVSTPVTITVTSHVAKVFDIHTDHLPPRVITDSNGNPVWRWDSAPFGETLPDENPQKTGSTDNFVLNLRFPGQYFDRETNCTTTTIVTMIRRRDGTSSLIRLACVAGLIRSGMSGEIR